MSKVIITFEVPITHSFISTEKITHSGSDLSNILAWAVTYGKSFIANILQISKLEWINLPNTQCAHITTYTKNILSK